MGDPFICNKCGAPRKYINQFCPECFSTGPHLEAPTDKKSRINVPAFRKKPPEKDLFSDHFEPPKHSVKNKTHSDTDNFADEYEYARPRNDKVLKEPKQERSHPPKIERDTLRDEDIDDSGERVKSSKFSLPGRSLLYGTFFIVLAILIILIVINYGDSGSNNSNTVSTNQPVNNGTSNVSGSNTTVSTNASPATPAVTANTTQPATIITPKVTTIPRLIGNKPEVIPTDSSVTLAWQTDEKSKSTVKYGTTKACDFFSPEESTYKTEHNVYLPNLTSDTLYYYQIIAINEAGNNNTLVEASFRTESRSEAAPYVASKAPDFSLRTLEGKQVSLSQYRGKKVILNFWASWCTPCKVELPHLQEIWAKYKDGNEVMVLTVAGSESVESEIRSYIDSKGYTFPVCLDATESTFNRYDLTTIPKTYFIDKNGIIKKIQQGMFTSPGEIEFMLSSY